MLLFDARVSTRDKTRDFAIKQADLTNLIPILTKSKFTLDNPLKSFQMSNIEYIS